MLFEILNACEIFKTANIKFISVSSKHIDMS